MSRRARDVFLTLVIAGAVALTLRHDLVALFEAQARARLAAGDPGAAESSFRRAARIGGNAAVHGYELGVGLYRGGDFAGAQRQFSAALTAAAPELAAAARHNRGNSIFRQAEAVAASDRQAAARLFAEAAADYAEALVLAPGAADSAANLGLARARVAALAGESGSDGRPAGEDRQADAGADASGGSRPGNAGQGGSPASPEQPDAQPQSGQTAGGRDNAHDAPGRSRPDLTPGDVERILNDARGREKPAGSLHESERHERPARPEKDW